MVPHRPLCAVTRAANDTHADCLRIITRAEMRMANEIDRQPNAQGRRSDIPRTSGEVEPTYSDLGVTSQRVSEWRETRDAGPEVVEQAIQGALAEGRPPTKALYFFVFFVSIFWSRSEVCK